METTFKVGQKVWDNALGFGRGQVEGSAILLYIVFEAGFSHYYTSDGCFKEGFAPTLSHTPYTLSGFSQEPVKEGSFLERRWYKNKSSNTFGFYINEGNNKGFYKKKWDDAVYMSHPNEWQLIDDSNGAELKELLTKEAIRRGAVVGAKVNNKHSFSSCIRPIEARDEFYFMNSLSVVIRGHGTGMIFNGGIWAEIEQPFLYAGKTGIGKIDGREFEFTINKEIK